jgi:hypothetical protein
MYLNLCAQPLTPCLPFLTELTKAEQVSVGTLLVSGFCAFPLRFDMAASIVRLSMTLRTSQFGNA